MANYLINSFEFNDNIHSFSLPYGVCATAADTAAKTVTVDNFALETGAMIVVKFTNTNSASEPTLNVNGTGAKPMYRYGTSKASTSQTTSGWRAGAVQIFVYDGTGWIRDFWENTTYSNVALGQGYATCSTAATTTAKTASLSSYSLTTGGVVSVKFTYAVPAKATLSINSKDAKAIYFRGAEIVADVIKAGDIATFIYNGSYYHLLSIDRWQTDIASLQAALPNKSDTGHTHDDRYYTETEVNTKLDAINTTLQTKVNKTGDTMTGSLTFANTAKTSSVELKYDDTYKALKFIFS